MNRHSLASPRSQVIAAIAFASLVVAAPFAMATGCWVNSPINCSDIYVDPSPDCEDIITGDQTAYVAVSVSPPGQAESTPTSCTISVIRKYALTDGGPCYTSPDSTFPVGHNTASGAACN